MQRLPAIPVRMSVFAPRYASSGSSVVSKKAEYFGFRTIVVFVRLQDARDLLARYVVETVFGDTKRSTGATGCYGAAQSVRGLTARGNVMGSAQ
jgi:hypothetical protein